jgi:hypothetical protein
MATPRSCADGLPAAYGLNNCGGKCYCNTVLQLLASCPTMIAAARAAAPEQLTAAGRLVKKYLVAAADDAAAIDAEVSNHLIGAFYALGLPASCNYRGNSGVTEVLDSILDYAYVHGAPNALAAGIAIDASVVCDCECGYRSESPIPSSILPIAPRYLASAAGASVAAVVTGANVYRGADAAPCIQCRQQRAGASERLVVRRLASVVCVDIQILDLPEHAALRDRVCAALGAEAEFVFAAPLPADSARYRLAGAAIRQGCHFYAMVERRAANGGDTAVVCISDSSMHVELAGWASFSAHRTPVLLVYRRVDPQ